MRRWSTVSFASILLVVGFGTASPITDARAKVLVEQLGSKKYAERSAAAKELTAMGRAAKAALIAGQQSADWEIQERCRLLLPLALENDLRFRLAEYVSDEKGVKKHDLPMLEQFAKMAGNDAPARLLYRQIVERDGSLVELMHENPSKAVERVHGRAYEIYSGVFGDPWGNGIVLSRSTLSQRGDPIEIATLLLLSTHPDYKPSPNEWLLTNMFGAPGFSERLKDSKDGVAFRRLFAGYLEKRLDENLINQCVWVLCQSKVSETVPALTKAVSPSRTWQPYSRGNLLSAIGTIGSKKDAAALKDLLTDKSQLQQFRVAVGQQAMSVQVRDVALAMTIHLNGKNPKDYGFTRWQLYPNQMIQVHQLGFAGDADRDAAFQKWEKEKPTN